MSALEDVLNDPVIPIVVRWEVTGRALRLVNMRHENSIREDHRARVTAACKRLEERVEPMLIVYLAKFITKSTMNTLTAKVADIAVKVSREFHVTFAVTMEIIP